ncbi:MAG: response regulator [Gammaproteobacteria bacterium]|nr:response regulator [Gammaproteobacteria bacterium]
MTGEQILIVEDQRTVAGAMRTRLRGLGYGVAGIASNGLEAIEKAQELNPDLVLMDIRLGDGIDGIEAAQRICATKEIPIIYVSAYADHDVIARARVTNPAGFINKPFTTKDLLSAIELALYRDTTPPPNQAPKRVIDFTQENEPVVTCDATGIVIFVNRSAESECGLKRREVTGTPVSGIIQRLCGLSVAQAEALVDRCRNAHDERTIPVTSGAQASHAVLAPLFDAHGAFFGIALRLSVQAHPLDRAELGNRVTALGRALDPMPMGVLILSRRMHVLFANREAQRLLVSTAGISCEGGKLRVSNDVERRLLQKLLDEALHTTPAHCQAPVGLARIHDPETDSTLVISIMSSTCGDDPDRSPVAIAYLFDPNQSRQISIDVLMSEYRLTEAECRLVALMMNGTTLENAASQLEIAANTARTHLKNIFQKTGTKRQTELLLKLARGPAGLIFGK